MSNARSENDRKLGGTTDIVKLNALASVLKGNVTFGRKQYPDSVIAVFELTNALANYNCKDLTPNEINGAGEIMKKLTESLTTFIKETGGAKGGVSRKSEEYQKALDAFTQDCTTILTENFQDLAAKDTLWNAVKGLFISACKALGFEPPVKLDATDIIKDQQIADKFKNLSKHSDVKIDGKNEVDVSLEDDSEKRSGPGSGF